MDSTELRLTATINHSGGWPRVTGEGPGAAVLLYVGGSVDASNVAAWRQLLRLAAGITRAPGLLIVDTNGLEFLACCAFVALAEESARCRRRGIRLCLVSNQGITARVVAAGRWQSALALYPSIDAAIGDEHHPTITLAAGSAVAG